MEWIATKYLEGEVSGHYPHCLLPPPSLPLPLPSPSYASSSLEKSGREAKSPEGKIVRGRRTIVIGTVRREEMKG